MPNVSFTPKIKVYGKQYKDEITYTLTRTACNEFLSFFALVYSRKNAN